MYAVLENSSTGKTINFVSQEDFCTWAHQVPLPISWSFIGGFVYDIVGDRSLAEHIRHWLD